MDTQRGVLEAQFSFWNALKSKDASLYERVLADDFVSVGQENQSRAKFIEQLTSFPVEILSIKGDRLQVHVYGEIAVLTGVQEANLRLPDGHEVIESLVITNVFQYENNQWRMVLVHPASATTED